MENIPVNLQLTVAEINLILEGLAELPFKRSVALINALKNAGETAITQASAQATTVQDLPEDAVATEKPKRGRPRRVTSVGEDGGSIEIEHVEAEAA